MLIPHLEKKYKKKFIVEEITEKDIIYFCRDALAHSLTEKNKGNNQKSIYEKEILSLIKLKEWDWFAKDIDKNIILTYPVYNNAFTIVEYILENKKYNLEQYNEQCSGALKACIMLTGEKMQEYILSKNIHSEYITDMAFKAYTMSEYVMPKYKNEYLKKAEELIQINTNFEKLVMNFLKYDEFEKVRQTFYLFLEEHPLPIIDKREYIATVLQDIQEQKSGAKYKAKYIDLGKWLQYNELNDKLNYKKNIENNQKMKI